jgi:hypothetical protein
LKRYALWLLPLILGGAGPGDDLPLKADGSPVWADASIAEAARIRTLPQTPSTYEGSAYAGATTTVEEATPQSVPQLLSNSNASGLSASFLPAGPFDVPSEQGFFQGLGTNGRTCQTCHRPANGWSITPPAIKALFASSPSAPLFRPVDGTVCATADTSTPAAAAAACSLLLNKGLIRIFIKLPAPPTLQFSITKVVDPYNCHTNPASGLTSPTAGIVSVYRRPLEVI